MPKFKLYIDEKATVWQRHYYEVEADTQEQANERMKVEMNSMDLPGEGDVEFKESEILFDTMEYMLPPENDLQATRQLFTDDGEDVADNRPK